MPLVVSAPSVQRDSKEALLRFTWFFSTKSAVNHKTAINVRPIFPQDKVFSGGSVVRLPKGRWCNLNFTVKGCPHIKAAVSLSSHTEGCT